MATALYTAPFLLLFALSAATLGGCNMEAEALSTQRAAWSDPNNVLSSWDPSLANPCTWFHVTCNTGNSVVRLDLGSAGISGPLVPQLASLRNLQYLELYNNQISGRIPTQLGNLVRLVSLDLQLNNLSGPIPPSLGKLKSLIFLRLNGNKLSGRLPKEVLDLVRTGNIRIMNISANNLDGTNKGSPNGGLAIATIIQDAKA